MTVKCLAQEHDTMSPARVRTLAARSGVEGTNHEATVPPPLPPPSKGSRNTSSHFIIMETGMLAGLMGHLAGMQTLLLPYLASLLCIQSPVTCDEMKKFVAVWDNRFLEQVKLCSERIPGKLKYYFPKI